MAKHKSEGPQRTSNERYWLQAREDGAWVQVTDRLAPDDTVTVLPGTYKVIRADGTTIGPIKVSRTLAEIGRDGVIAEEVA